MSSASERPLLQAGLGDRVSLHFHGACFGSPVSEAHTRNLTSQPGHCMVLHGCNKNSRIGELLAGLAAVIVPSLWLDNEPLTIQEAQIAGVPVITGNQGGMAELVRDGVDGLHFRLGDARDLRRVLPQVIEDPDQLQAMRSNAPQVPGIEAQSMLVRQPYLQTIKAKPRLA